MTIKCEVVQDLLPLYIDDHCSKESRELLDVHIQSCDACKTVLKTMQDELPLGNESEKLKGLEAKKPFKKLRNMVITYVSIITSILIIVLVGGYLYLTNVTHNELNVAISSIDVSDHEINVVGSSTNSANGYNGFDYQIEGDSLYLQLKYTTLVSSRNPSGDFEITINENFTNIKKVYIEGEKQGYLLLVWER
ncbi:MAG: zf-HC2 domain-containing protein [Anaerobacillus sp.]|uniref:zf-HC2 domain-containing protein n=1 Tax=Anaerobacillus sp. TaxID=1872506 RepID=UPI00391A6FB3